MSAYLKKYHLPLDSREIFHVPKGSIPLCAGHRPEGCCVWFQEKEELGEDGELVPTTVFRLTLVEEGDEARGTYLSRFMVLGRSFFVFYEELP